MAQSSILTSESDPDFVKLEESCICPVCRGVLKDAVQSECGHRYCFKCIDEVLSTQEPAKCPADEGDCEVIHRSQIVIDAFARKQVLALSVYCTYRRYGCKQPPVKWKDLESHRQQCPYRPIECPNRAKGCDVARQRTMLDEHVRTDCQYRNETCQYCGNEVMFINLQTHQEEACTMKMRNCPNNCDLPEMARDDLVWHLQSCPNRRVPCEYSEAGCEFNGTQKDLSVHMSKNHNEHLKLMNKYVVALINEKQQFMRSLNEYETLCNQLKSKLDEKTKDYADLTQTIEKLKASNKDLKLKFVSQTERIIHLERKSNELADKAVIDLHARELRVAQETLAELKQKISRCAVSGAAGTPDGTQVLSNMADTLMRQLTQHDRQIGLSDIRLAELDLRSQIIETVSYDGTLMWKIRDYTRRKKEAIAGKTLSLYSQPFYTSRYGYKLCARVYLNGDGMGKGNHLSLFFVVMHGEYDELLPWPFQQKVTLMLLDQENRNRHLSDTFKPDPSSNSFRKPTSDMNVASGCPLFVSHAVLETRTYTKDDTLFIKVEVDSHNCPKP